MPENSSAAYLAALSRAESEARKVPWQTTAQRPGAIANDILHELEREFDLTAPEEHLLTDRVHAVCATLARRADLI